MQATACQDELGIPAELLTWASTAEADSLCQQVCDKTGAHSIEYERRKQSKAAFFVQGPNERIVCKAKELLQLHLTFQVDVQKNEGRMRKMENDLEASKRELASGLRDEFSVDPDLIAVLIGKRGANIKHVKEKTGVDRIIVDTETGTVRIKGSSRDAVQSAREMLEYQTATIDLSHDEAQELDAAILEDVRSRTSVSKLALNGQGRHSFIRLMGTKAQVAFAKELLSTHIDYKQRIKAQERRKAAMKSKLDAIDVDYGDGTFQDKSRQFIVGASERNAPHHHQPPPISGQQYRGRGGRGMTRGMNRGGLGGRGGANRTSHPRSSASSASRDDTGKTKPQNISTRGRSAPSSGRDRRGRGGGGGVTSTNPIRFQGANKNVKATTSGTKSQIKRDYDSKMQDGDLKKNRTKRNDFEEKKTKAALKKNHMPKPASSANILQSELNKRHAAAAKNVGKTRVSSLNSSKALALAAAPPQARRNNAKKNSSVQSTSSNLQSSAKAKSTNVNLKSKQSAQGKARAPQRVDQSKDSRGDQVKSFPPKQSKANNNDKKQNDRSVIQQANGAGKLAAVNQATVAVVKRENTKKKNDSNSHVMSKKRAELDSNAKHISTTSTPAVKVKVKLNSSNSKPKENPKPQRSRKKAVANTGGRKKNESQSGKAPSA